MKRCQKHGVVFFNYVRKTRICYDVRNTDPIIVSETLDYGIMSEILIRRMVSDTLGYRLVSETLSLIRMVSH